MKKWLLLGLCIVLVLATVTAIAIAANPGTQEDPLISKSYVESILKPELYAYIDAKSASGSATEPASFVVVNVGAGKTVIGDAGTEMILRMGKGTIVGSARGGLADVTQGGDLGSGTPIPANHMLIVPLSDGRGVRISAETDAILMIKGGYSIR